MTRRAEINRAQSQVSELPSNWQTLEAYNPLSQTTGGINPTCWAVTELMRQLNYLIQREKSSPLPTTVQTRFNQRRSCQHLLPKTCFFKFHVYDSGASSPSSSFKC